MGEMKKSKATERSMRLKAFRKYKGLPKAGKNSRHVTPYTGHIVYNMRGEMVVSHVKGGVRDTGFFPGKASPWRKAEAAAKAKPLPFKWGDRPKEWGEETIRVETRCALPDSKGNVHWPDPDSLQPWAYARIETVPLKHLSRYVRPGFSRVFRDDLYLAPEYAPKRAIKPVTVAVSRTVEQQPYVVPEPAKVQARSVLSLLGL